LISIGIEQKMSFLSAIVVAALFACGAYLLLRRGLFEALLGLALLSQGTNLLIIAASGWKPLGNPPFTDGAISAEGPESVLSAVDPRHYVDPVPHALILTAIVIGFGLLSFLMVLIARARAEGGVDSLDDAPDSPAPPAPAKPADSVGVASDDSSGATSSHEGPEASAEATAEPGDRHATEEDAR